MVQNYDFAGWATRANRLCSDGRTIMKDAFKECDGKKVPLVWNHNHTIPQTVLGHAILENRDGDMYAYCKFNDTDSGKDAKALVVHGDICALSIYANQLREQPKNHVIHGTIREVSLVLAGANPGAFIDSTIVHSDGTTELVEDQAVIYTGESIELFHAEEPKKDEKPAEEHEDKPQETEKKPEETEKKEEGETVKDVFDTLTEKQKTAVYAVIGAALSEDGEEEKDNSKEDEKMARHNAFEREADPNVTNNYLTHADGVAILKMARENGGCSLRTAIAAYAEMNQKDGVLQHSAALEHAADDNNFADISQLFPEYKTVGGPEPEVLTTDQGWIKHVMDHVGKSPMSRLRVRKTDARDLTGRRAQGYTKGSQKQFMGNLTLLNRTVDPTTVYNLDKINRDDKIDITDFDIVQYLYKLQQMNLKEELARQIMIGDGRIGDPSQDDGQEIDKTKIIPIWGDDSLFTIHTVLDVAAMRSEMNGTNSTANFGDNYVYAEAVIQSLLYAREGYKGSGGCDFYCTPRLRNVMLLSRDLNGRRVFENVNDLKSALDVNNIITAEQFANKTRTVTVNGVEQTRRLLGILVNIDDYKLGCVKGGEITHFTDFDLRFNQDLSLLETRCSGMLVKPYSAIVLEEVVNP